MVSLHPTVHILEDVLYQSLPEMSPTYPVRTRGSACHGSCPPVKPEPVCEFFLHDPPTTSGASHIKPLPRIVKGFVMRGSALSVHRGLLPSIPSSYDPRAQVYLVSKPLPKSTNKGY